MRPRRMALGYTEVALTHDTTIGAAGAVARGHEFHYSTLDPPGDALDLTGRFGAGRDGYASPTLLASYLHLHLGAHPAPAERFVAVSST